MKLLLNIGLARTGNSNIGTGTVLRELSAPGLKLITHALHHSDTEITVVADVELTGWSARDTFYYVAERLGQDCIAVYNPAYKVGALIGPKAAAWGEFNPEFFLLLDGSRLATPLQVAA